MQEIELRKKEIQKKNMKNLFTFLKNVEIEDLVFNFLIFYLLILKFCDLLLFSIIFFVFFFMKYWFYDNCKKKSKNRTLYILFHQTISFFNKNLFADIIFAIDPIPINCC